MDKFLGRPKVPKLTQVEIYNLNIVISIKLNLQLKIFTQGKF